MFTLKNTTLLNCSQVQIVSHEILKVLTVLIVLVSTSLSIDANASERPNIILLMGDDHGWDETGYNGHPYLKTPVLNEMAANGIRLDRFYAAHPSCSPTRGSVLTGRHPNRYGVFAPGCSIRPEEITLAKVLNEAGYDCSHFGKWHLGPVKANSPTNPGAMGFDYWLSHDNFFELNPVMSRNGGPPEKFVGEGSRVIVDDAIKHLSQIQQQHKPFFVVIWYGSPHEPYSGLPEDLALYRQLPARYNDLKVRVTSNKTGEQVERPLGGVLRERYAEITAMDRSIGHLRDWLATHGLRDNTLMWYCGDNGSWADGAITSPFRGYKGMIYEGGVRVPSVIEWPGRFPQQRITRMNSVTTDILPTIFDLLDLPLPNVPLDGESLVPAFTKSEARRKNPICFWDFKPADGALKGLDPYIDPELQRGTTPLVKKMGGLHTRNFKNLRIPNTDDRFLHGPRAILDHEYKLVVTGTAGEANVQLFDISSDPGEHYDIADQEPESTDKLQHLLHKWQESVLASLTGADY